MLSVCAILLWGLFVFILLTILEYVGRGIANCRGSDEKRWKWDKHDTFIVILLLITILLIVVISCCAVSRLNPRHQGHQSMSPYPILRNGRLRGYNTPVGYLDDPVALHPVDFAMSSLPHGAAFGQSSRESAITPLVLTPLDAQSPFVLRSEAPIPSAPYADAGAGYRMPLFTPETSRDFSSAYSHSSPTGENVAYSMPLFTPETSRDFSGAYPHSLPVGENVTYSMPLFTPEASPDFSGAYSQPPPAAKNVAYTMSLFTPEVSPDLTGAPSIPLFTPEMRSGMDSGQSGQSDFQWRPGSSPYAEFRNYI